MGGAGRLTERDQSSREGLRLVEQREAKDAAKLKALRAAARHGIAALDRGDFKEFDSVADLERYLKNLSDKVIAASVK